MQQARHIPSTTYRYYGAPAAAFREGGLAEHYLGAREAAQALALSAALTPHDFVSALTAYGDAQVEAVKAPNGMAPAATVMHHADHPLPRNSPRKFVKKISETVQPAMCEVCKVEAVKAPNGMAPAATVMHHADHPLPRNSPRKFVKKISETVQPAMCEVCKVEAVKAPNGMAPAATVMHHADHPLPRNAPRKFVKKISETVQPAMCEVCKVEAVKAPNGMAPAATVMHHADHPLPRNSPRKFVKKISETVQPAMCEVCKVEAVKAPNGMAPAATVMHHADHPLPRNAPRKFVKKISETVQPAMCEVCKVEAVKAPNGMAPAATVMHHADHPLPRNAPRKFVKKISKTVQPAMCEVCKVQLTNQHDLEKHIIGRKHKNNLKKLNDSITPNPENPPNGAVGESTVPAAAVAVGVIPDVVLESGASQGERKICMASNVVKEIPKVQPATCGVCKKKFTTLHGLRDHETSQNHKKDLEKLQDSVTPEPAKPPNGAVGASTAPAAAVTDGVIPAVQPMNTSRPSTPEDLEAKKTRVLEGGAAQGELEICTVSNVVKKIPEVVQPVTCEVCKKKFTTLNGLRDHERSNKHKMNLEKLQDSLTPEPAKPPNFSIGASTAPAVAVVDGVIPAVQPKMNTSRPSTPEDLEAKKTRVLEGGAAQGEVEICTVSNVVKKIPEVVQSVTCEVCKNRFTTLNGLRDHERSKKHKMNLEKLQESLTPEPAKPPIGASTTPAAAVADGVIPAVVLGAESITLELAKYPNGAVEASTSPAAAVADGGIPTVQPKRKRPAATPEDLEARKRRLIETGVAEGELKICTMCNVLTKDQKNFESHIAGAKHKANVRKQQLAQLPHVA